MKKKRQQNDLLTFLGGLAMLVAGMYWFISRITVTSTFFSAGFFTIGGMELTSGLIVVPFIATIVWLFVNPDSFWAKICVALSLLLIVAAVIITTRLRFADTPLYMYLLILVFIFGGGAMVLKVLCNPKYRDDDDEKKEK